MFRYLRAVWYLITGRVNSLAEGLQTNPHVMAATYDAAIEASSKRYSEAKNGVAKLLTIEQDKVSRLNRLTERFEKLQKIKNSAAGKAKELADNLKAQGKSVEEIQKDSEFLKHQSAFQNASTSSKELEEEIQGIEQDIEENKSRIATYKLQLQEMQRSNKSLREEKQEAIADVAIAKEMQAVNDVLSGIAENTIDKDLASAREARKNAKAKAQITSELAGNDATLLENEYLEYASQNEATSEFASLIGLAEEVAIAPLPPQEEASPAKLPEE